MTHSILDYRSDTFTKPTAAMRSAMAEAEVGDDVFDEDPTIHRLQEHVAKLLGKEAALFFPSGSMSNQVAVRVHCLPGDEMICEAECHIYTYEQAAYAQLSGVATRTVPGVSGVLEPQQLEGLIRPDDDHAARTRLVTLENTHNRGGGRIQPIESIETICRWAHEHNLITHLDGARLMNAVVASGIPASRWAAPFDTVSICFSKGLGAPVGSALVGTAEMIRAARRHRKCFGGGMRQAGIIAAGALYAMENHVDRLAEDHQHASRLGELIDLVDGLKVQGENVDTNMVVFRVDAKLGTAAEFTAKLAEHDVLMLPTGPDLIRAVTHLDVPANGAERTGEILKKVASQGN